MKTESSIDHLSGAIRDDDATALENLLSSTKTRRHIRRWFGFRRETPLLQVAAAADALNATLVLLKQHAEVDELGPEGSTALEIAAYRGNRAICKLLLDYGACPSRLGRKKGTPSALAIAAYAANADLVELFLLHGADPDDVCSNKSTLFRVHGDVLRRLISAGGKVPEEVAEILRQRHAIGDFPWEHGESGSIS